MSQEQLLIYTITDHPSDHPDKFAVRRQIISKLGTQSDPDFLMLTDTLEAARDEMMAMGLVVLPRDPSDHPVIVESWI